MPPLSTMLADNSAAGNSTASCQNQAQKKEKPPPQQKEPCYLLKVVVTADRHVPIEYLPASDADYVPILSEDALKILCEKRLEVLAGQEKKEPHKKAKKFLTKHGFKMKPPKNQPCTIKVELQDWKGCKAQNHPWIVVMKSSGSWISAKMDNAEAAQEQAAEDAEKDGWWAPAQELIGGWGYLSSWWDEPKGKNDKYYHVVLNQKASHAAKFEVKCGSPMILVNAEGLAPSDQTLGLIAFWRLLWNMAFDDTAIDRYYLCIVACPYAPGGQPKDRRGWYCLHIDAFPPDRYMFLMKTKLAFKQAKFQNGLVDTDGYLAKLQRNDEVLYETKPQDDIVGMLTGVAKEEFNNASPNDSTEWTLTRIVRRVVQIIGSADVKYLFWWEGEYRFLSGGLGMTWRYKEQTDAHYVYAYCKAAVHIELLGGYVRGCFGIRVSLADADEADDSSDWIIIECKVYVKLSGNVRADGKVEWRYPDPVNPNVDPDAGVKLGELKGTAALEIGFKTVVLAKFIDIKVGANVPFQVVGKVTVGGAEPVMIQSHGKRGDAILRLRGSFVWGLWEYEGKKEIFGESNNRRVDFLSWP